MGKGRGLVVHARRPVVASQVTLAARSPELFDSCELVRGLLLAARMTKKIRRKLSIARHTLRALTTPDLEAVQGGFITLSTIILSANDTCTPVERPTQARSCFC